MRVSSLLEELLETLEVLEDRELLPAMREAEEDLKVEKIRPYDEVAREGRAYGSYSPESRARPT